MLEWHRSPSVSVVDMESSVKYTFSGDGKMGARQTIKKWLCAIISAILVFVSVMVFIVCTTVVVSEFKDMKSEYSELRRDLDELKLSVFSQAVQTQHKIASVLDSSKTKQETDLQTSLNTLFSELKELKKVLNESKASESEKSSAKDNRADGLSDLQGEVVKLTRDMAEFQADILTGFSSLSANITDDINESIDQTKNVRKTQLKDFMNDKIHKNQQFTKLTSRIEDRFSRTDADIAVARAEVESAATDTQDQIQAARLAVIDKIKNMSSYVIEDLQAKMDEVKQELKDMIDGVCLSGQSQPTQSPPPIPLN